MASPPSSVRQRGGPNVKKGSTPTPGTSSQNGQPDVLAKVKQQSKEAVTSEWDFKLALLIFTALAFVTRFWGLGHPDQVVFDEVHFGKVCVLNRRLWIYFHFGRVISILRA